MAVGLLLAAAACGDNDGDGTVASTTATPATTTEPPSTTATPATMTEPPSTTATPATTTEPPSTTATPATMTEPPSLPDIQDIEEAGALVIDTSGNADWVTVAGDSAWVANVGTGITRYDLATGEVLGEIETNDICLAMDEGFGSLWAGDCVDNTLLRIDVATGELVATIDLPFASIPGESSVAVGEGGVWMLSTGTQPDLVHIDPATNEVADTFPAPRGAPVTAPCGSPEPAPASCSGSTRARVRSGP